jgi:hypothetical protein
MPLPEGQIRVAVAVSQEVIQESESEASSERKLVFNV